jgi:hypothetical protein
MERTANNIADKMEANTNGFRERPDQAGRPRGRKNNATIMREVLQAKNLKITDPQLYMINKVIEIIEEPETLQGHRINAIFRLFEQAYGKPIQKTEPIEQTPQNRGALIVAKTDPSKDELISMARDLGRAVFIVEDKEDKQMMEKMKNF